MFNFKKIDSDQNEYQVLFNDSVINGAIAYERNFKSWDKNFDIQVENREVGEQLISLIEKDFTQVYSLTINRWNNLNGFNLTLKIYEDSIGYSGIFKLNIDQQWELTHSFDDYFIEFSRLFGTQEFAINLDDYNGYIEIELEFSLKSPLLDYIRKSEDLLIEYHKFAIESLSNNSANSINAVFDFPKEVQVACEQYLMYFAQFLRDLGINTHSTLKEEAGKVLFSVTPTDDVEALDKIREALAVYLKLPSSPIVYDDSFAAMRLQQQIENLQHSQKMASRELQLTEKLVIAQSEMIQEKNLIISQKDTVIEQQNKVIEKITSKSIMMDSSENKEDFEKVFEGLEVGESKFIKEQIGIRFNPVTLLKTLGKKLIGKDDEIISILESGEEQKKIIE